MTTAISATRRQLKEMADGTIRVQIDIDPAYRKAFLEMFPDIDMPVALAPLNAGFERAKEPEPEKPKGGPLARLAGMWCRDQAFRAFAHVEDEETAAAYILGECGIQSRAELDHNPQAASIFHERIRHPFKEFRERLSYPFG